MSKSITEQFPPRIETTLVQAQVDKKLVDLVKKQMLEDSRSLNRRLTWSDLFEASFKRYLSERKPRR